MRDGGPVVWNCATFDVGGNSVTSRRSGVGDGVVSLWSNSAAIDKSFTVLATIAWIYTSWWWWWWHWCSLALARLCAVDDPLSINPEVGVDRIQFGVKHHTGNEVCVGFEIKLPRFLIANWSCGLDRMAPHSCEMNLIGEVNLDKFFVGVEIESAAGAVVGSDSEAVSAGPLIFEENLGVGKIRTDGILACFAES